LNHVGFLDYIYGKIIQAKDSKLEIISILHVFIGLFPDT